MEAVNFCVLDSAAGGRTPVGVVHVHLDYFMFSSLSLWCANVEYVDTAVLVIGPFFLEHTLLFLPI